MYTLLLSTCLIAPGADYDAFGSPAPSARHDPFRRPIPQTYGEAVRRSLAEQKPLIVWVGSAALCPLCIDDTQDEFVHWITKEFPGAPSAALVVGMPEGETLWRAATLAEWPEGHITTIRAAVRDWRSPRCTPAQSNPVPQQGFYAPNFYAPRAPVFTAPPRFSRGGRSG